MWIPILLALLGAPQEPRFRVETLEPPPHASGVTPSLVSTGEHALLSWQERAEDGSFELRFSALEDTGWSAPRTIASGKDWFVNWADFPALATREDGTWLAHWLQYLGEGTYAYGIRFVLSRDAGKSWSEPAWLHTDRLPVEHGFASFVEHADGFQAVWLDGRFAGGEGADGHGHGRTALMGRFLDGDDELGPETILDPLVCDCCPTSLIRGRAPAPELLVLYRDRSEDEVRDIGFAASSSGAWRRPASVHDDGWVIAGCPVNGPRLAGSGGRIAAAWFAGAEIGGGAVRVAMYDLRNGRFAAPIELDAGAPEGRVDAVFLADGTLAVTWLEHTEAGRSAWFVRCISTDGEPGEALLVAEVSGERASGYLRMAADGDGALLAWTEGKQPARIGMARLVPDP